MTLQVDGRHWDAFDAYLFDIDGTLLHCEDAVHYFAFCDALSVVARRPMTLDGVVTQGNVDVGILRDALALAGIAEETWRPRLQEMCAGMCRYVETHRGEFRAVALPGVRAVLEHLRSHGAVLATGTGNLEGIGRAKLVHVGLNEFFTVGGWSDGFEQRAEVIGAALARVRVVAGAGATVCVVGDTPADVAAAGANGLPVIAVATGTYSREELAAATPDLLVDSLTALVS